MVNRMKRTLCATIVCALALCWAVRATARPNPPRLPAGAGRVNLLLIVTDDESWFEHSIYGHSNLKTPHFDRLAKEGVLFRNAYVSAPSCGPSRAAILTGRNFWELEQGAFMLSFLPKKFSVLPQILVDHGYQSAFAGKGWGPGIVPKEGQGGLVGTPYYDIKITDYEKRGYLDRHDVPANFAAFLDERDADKPFFFWAGISEPHGRWPGGAEARRRLKEEFGVDAEKINREPGNNPNIKPPGFYYEILDADRQTGRMLADLEKRGLLENTMVVYIGDNGSTDQPAAGFKGKGSPYDGGSHVPMALMWKGKVPPNRIIDDFVKGTDIAPTFLQAAGAPVPKEMTGNSILDMILSDKSGWLDPKRDFVMTGNEWHTNPKTARTIRDKRYEYIVKYPNSERPELVEELYDLESDMWEQNNLIDDPEYAPIRDRLKARMHAYGRETGDPRSTGDLALFNETLAVQALLWPQYRKDARAFRMRVAGKPYAELKEYLGVAEVSE